MILPTLLTIGLIFSAEGATNAAPTQTAQAVAAPAKPEKICEKVKPMGSRLPKTVCRTREEIDATRQASQDATRDMQRISPAPVQ